jgi:DNA-binding transcriptional LysR family regulator
MNFIYNIADIHHAALVISIMLLETLKVYRDLVDTGSFSKAAELNYLTQPAVSHQIKNLEASLGCVLLSRSPRDLRLTPAGLVFYRTAKRMLQTYDDMTAQLKSVTERLSGSVRIATIYSVGTYAIQDYIRRFIRLHPDAQLSVDYRKAGRVYDDVIRGRADLGIIAYAARRRGLEIIPLHDEEMVLVCHPRHAFASLRRLGLEALDGHDFIAFDDAAPTRAAVDKLLRAHGVKTAVKLELDNIETIKSAVQAGTGLSILPEATVRNEVRSGKLCALRFQGQKILRPVAVVAKKGGPANPAARVFLDYLLKERDIAPPGSQPSS